MSEIAEQRLKKAAETLFTEVEDPERNRLVNDIVPVMEALEALNGSDNGSMVLLEEGLASLEGAKLSMLAAILGLSSPNEQFFDNLDFAEKKISVASKLIETLREVGEVRKLREAQE